MQAIISSGRLRPNSLALRHTSGGTTHTAGDLPAEALRRCSTVREAPGTDRSAMSLLVILLRALSASPN